MIKQQEPAGDPAARDWSDITAEEVAASAGRKAAERKRPAQLEAVLALRDPEAAKAVVDDYAMWTGLSRSLQACVLRRAEWMGVDAALEMYVRSRIAEFRRSKGGPRPMWESEKTIAGLLGVTHAAVRKSVQRLTATGVIARAGHNGQGRRQWTVMTSASQRKAEAGAPVGTISSPVGTTPPTGRVTVSHIDDVTVCHAHRGAPPASVASLPPQSEKEGAIGGRAKRAEGRSAPVGSADLPRHGQSLSDTTDIEAVGGTPDWARMAHRAMEACFKERFGSSTFVYPFDAAKDNMQFDELWQTGGKADDSLRSSLSKALASLPATLTQQQVKALATGRHCDMLLKGKQADVLAKVCDRHPRTQPQPAPTGQSAAVAEPAAQTAPPSPAENGGLTPEYMTESAMRWFRYIAGAKHMTDGDKAVEVLEELGMEHARRMAPLVGLGGFDFDACLADMPAELREDIATRVPLDGDLAAMEMIFADNARRTS